LNTEDALLLDTLIALSGFFTWSKSMSSPWREIGFLSYGNLVIFALHCLKNGSALIVYHLLFLSIMVSGRPALLTVVAGHVRQMAC
jgi:DMSO/TMAO reductase YedYZ heme-binding membrane subunit